MSSYIGSPAWGSRHPGSRVSGRGGVLPCGCDPGASRGGGAGTWAVFPGVGVCTNYSIIQLRSTGNMQYVYVIQSGQMCVCTAYTVRMRVCVYVCVCVRACFCMNVRVSK